MPKARRAKDRQSGTGRDGRAKKGGRGGAYTWEGDGTDGRDALDADDPNYVGDEEEGPSEREQSFVQRISNFITGADSDSDGGGSENEDGGGTAQAAARLRAMTDSALASGRLVIQVHSAQDVQNVQHDDFFTVSEQEPYVFAEMLGKGEQRVGKAARTGKAEDTGTQGRQPVWAESEPALTLQLAPECRVLSVALWNHNMVKDDFIGRLEVPLVAQMLCVGQRAWFHLDTGGMIELTIEHDEADDGGGDDEEGVGGDGGGDSVQSPQPDGSPPSADGAAAAVSKSEPPGVISNIRTSLVGLFVSTDRAAPGEAGAGTGRFTPPGSPQPRMRIKGKQKRALEASPEFKTVVASRGNSRENSAATSPRRRASGSGRSDGSSPTPCVDAGPAAGLVAGVQSIFSSLVTSLDSGTLHIVAHGARELRSTQMFGQMDPYVVGRLRAAVPGGNDGADGAAPPGVAPVLAQGRTMYHYKGGTEPEWTKELDHELRLPLSADVHTLDLEVLNHNLVADDSLGRLQVVLSGTDKFHIKLGQRATYDLLPQGTVDLTISHEPAAAAAAAADAESS
eukprot:g2181.t1